MSEQTNNTEPAPLPSPSRRLHEVTLAALTRPLQGRSESAAVKQAATGTLAGQFLVDDASVVREESETLDSWMERLRVTAVAAFKVCAALNSEIVREELARAAVEEELVRIRNPEPVKS
jgi:hypothetical protein